MQTGVKNTDEYLAKIPAWQRKNLELFRKLVHTARPDASEEIKWGVPVFLIDGKMVFAMSSFKAHCKFNFIANGAALNDQKKLFNNGLESKKSRSIDLHEHKAINAKDLAKLITQSIEKL